MHTFSIQLSENGKNIYYRVDDAGLPDWIERDFVSCFYFSTKTKQFGMTVLEIGVRVLCVCVFNDGTSTRAHLLIICFSLSVCPPYWQRFPLHAQWQNPCHLLFHPWEITATRKFVMAAGNIIGNFALLCLSIFSYLFVSVLSVATAAAAAASVRIIFRRIVYDNNNNHGKQSTIGSLPHVFFFFLFFGLHKIETRLRHFNFLSSRISI